MSVSDFQGFDDTEEIGGEKVWDPSNKVRRERLEAGGRKQCLIFHTDAGPQAIVLCTVTAEMLIRRDKRERVVLRRK